MARRRKRSGGFGIKSLFSVGGFIMLAVGVVAAFLIPQLGSIGQSIASKVSGLTGGSSSTSSSN